MSPNGIKAGRCRKISAFLLGGKICVLVVQLCALAFSAILCISLTVVADEEVEEVVMLEEVVVTAQKREQRSFDVPLSISTLQGEKSDALRSSGMDVRFLSNRTPSLQMESSFGRVFPRFYIRGLGQYRL